MIINGTDANSIGTGSTPNLAVPATDSLKSSSFKPANMTRPKAALPAASSGGHQIRHQRCPWKPLRILSQHVLDANNYFLNRAGITRPPYQRNQFGGTLGGPIIKNRMWFFVSYQGSRERNGTSLTNSIGTVFVPRNLSNDRSDAGSMLLQRYRWVPARSGHGYSPAVDPTA